MTKNPTAKSTKAEILEAYESLQEEKKALESQVNKVQKEKPEKQPAVQDKQRADGGTTMTQVQVGDRQMNYTIESLTKLQLSFGHAVGDLSEKLTAEASKLEELRRGVTTEIQELQALHNVEVTPETLDNLVQAYENSSKAFEEESSQRRESYSQEILEQSQAWEKEQELHKRVTKERNDTQAKTRQREAQEYKYELQLQRQQDIDSYSQTQKALYKQLEESQAEREKQWAEREKEIAEREKRFEEFKAKVEGFPQEREAALKKAKEEGKGIANAQAKIKTDLYAKEVEGQKRFYELRVESLSETIQNQEARIQNLSKQLDSALKQVQDLAVKAIEGAANANSFQTLKEITLEQAKAQTKAK